MCRIISISNHKGGVGKTTTTINLGAGLSLMRYRVLLIDLDPQANLSQSLGITNPSETIYDRLVRRSAVRPQLVNVNNMDVIPSTLDLSAAETELAGEPGREFILREFLTDFRRLYDFILIDCPPSLGLLTINSLTASDEVIIPIQAEYLAIQGLSKLREVIIKIQSRLNENLKVTGVLITQYDRRKVLHKTIESTIKKTYIGKIFDSRIRDNISIAEAQLNNVDIFRYNKNSHGAEDYTGLCNEVIKAGEPKRNKQGQIKK
ncbi:MAG: ParA family protein [bacterium]|jgi:chromosome partitioning protein